MAEHRKQILCAALMVLILALAFHLRAKGMGWGLPDYFHPDERGVIMDSERIKFEEVPRREEEGWFEHFRRFAEVNLQKESSLNPRVFHYGSFPYYLLAGSRGLLNQWQEPVREGYLQNTLKMLPAYLLLVLALVALVLALSYRRKYPDEPLPKPAWWFLLGGFLILIAVVAVYQQPSVLDNTFTAETGVRPEGDHDYNSYPDDWEGTPSRFTLFFLSLVLLGPAALILLLQSFFTEGLSEKACHARLRIVFFLAGLILCAYLFGAYLPILLARHWRYANIGYVGRSLSALAGMATVAVVYAYGSRSYNRGVGLLAAIFLALTVLHIQLCHYGTFDVILAFFIYAALAFFERVQSRGTLWAYALAGLATGTAIATKFSALPLVFLFALPHVMYLLSLRKREQAAESRASLSFVRAWTGLALFLAVTCVAVLVFQPFAFVDSETFWRNINEQSGMARGEFLRPYTIQYLFTAPYFYPLKQLLFRGFGIPLAIFCLGGWLYCAVRQIRRGDKPTLLLLGWTVPSFLIYGQFHAKYPRYLVTIAPALCIMGAVFAVELLQSETIRKLRLSQIFPPYKIKRVAGILLALTLILTAIYAFGLARIYTRPHTWQVASDWIYENIPQRSRILTEAWDDELPKGRGKPRNYRFDHLPMPEQDTSAKIAKICEQLESGEYIVLATKRNYGSTLRDPARFPLTSNYYKALFSGYLGYEPIKVFEAPPVFLGLKLSDDLMDESLRVYDHPKVVIFEKKHEIPAGQLEELVTNPPRWVKSITYEEILSIKDGLPVYAKHPRYPVLRWYLCLQLLALVFFPLCFSLTRNLRDGGWSLARTASVLLFGYSVWLLSSMKIVPFTTGSTWVIVMIFMLLAIFLYWRYWPEIRILLRERYRVLIAEEIIWLAVLAFFVLVRMYNPAIFWGEKPMDTSFLAAAYRTNFFPPEDPWFSGHFINYYYYGHVLIATLGRLCGIPVHYLFNLAVGTIPALVAIGSFGVIYNLTSKVRYGLLGGWFTTFAGHLIGYTLMAENLSREGYSGLTGLIAMPFHIFYLAWKTLMVAFGADEKLILEPRATFGMLLGWAFAILGAIVAVAIAAGILKKNRFKGWILVSVLVLLVGILAGVWVQANAGSLFSFLPEGPMSNFRYVRFDGSYFWKASRIIEHTVANEFPIWTFLFADLHAHMIVMPFSILMIGLAFGVLSGRGDGLKPVENGQGVWWTVALLCITLGTIFCINAWDFPLAALLLLGVLLIKWRSHAQERLESHYPEESLKLLGIRSNALIRFLSPFYSFLAEVLLPAGMVVFLAIILFLPFHMYFDPRVKMGADSVLVSLGNMTPVSTWLLFFGVFFFFASSFILYWWHVSAKDETARWARWLLFLVIAVAGLAGSRVILAHSDSVLAFLLNSPLSKFVWYEKHFGRIVPIAFDYTLVAMLLPLWVAALWMMIRNYGNKALTYTLLLFWLAVSVAIGVEVVFIRETWAHPAHRYNTVFKFFLQVWMYMALAGVAGWYWIRSRRVAKDYGTKQAFLLPLRCLWWLAAVALIAISALFPIFGTYIIIHDPGARNNIGPRPTIDGFAYLGEIENGRRRPEFLTIHWLNRFVEGQPTLCEEWGLPYVHECNRISTHTGVPAVMGWDHHVRERAPSGRAEANRHNQEINRRKADIERIYRSNDKALVLELLDKWNVDYLYVGSYERQQKTTQPKTYTPDIEKFRGFGDALDLVFHTPGGDLYSVRKNLNGVYMGEVEVLPPPEERPKRKGENMYQGGTGFEGGNFAQPRSLTFDHRGRAYVADTFNHRIQVFDPKGEFLFEFGREGETRDEFKEPNDVIVAGTETLYIVDTWNHRVKVYRTNGEYLAQFGHAFYGPRGIALDGEENVFVADTGNGAIKVFRPEGRLLHQWGSRGSEPGQMSEPVGIDISAKGEVFVADTGNRRIQVFTKTGRLLRQWSYADRVEGQGGNEQHLRISPDGLIYLSNPLNGQIFVYDQEGNSLGDISKTGTVRAPLVFPVGLAFHPQTGDLTISDSRLNRMVRVPAEQLQKFSE